MTLRVSQIPRAPGFDSTRALLREGYPFISSRCDRLRSDAFRTRILLRPVVCMRGSAAAEMFYRGDRFTRVGAMPATALKLLQDRGSVQMLDGEDHRHRKRLFMSMMTPDSIARLVACAEAEWSRRQAGWPDGRDIVLFEELRTILMQAVCVWSGLALPPAEIERHTAEISEMIEAAGSLGLRNWHALLRRRRSERWARGIIQQLRQKELTAPQDSPVDLIASHHDRDGRLLDVESASVELLNVIRPTVAVAHFMLFAALALHACPTHAGRIRGGDQDFLDAFALEVRRHAPFFPLIGGRARTPFDHHGHRFAAGDWVLLDLYGTNRDPRCWPEPDLFRPERFLDRKPGAFDFVPQGAGDYFTTHRCPGEWVTDALLKMAARRFARMRYSLPAQDLTVDLSAMPALPRSGFVIRDVRPMD